MDTKNNSIISDEHFNFIRFVSWLGIIVNLLLAVLKVLLGRLGHSMILIGDGIDSLTDVVSSIISLIVVNIMRNPPDPKYPWGYRRADTIASKLISFLIFLAGYELIRISVVELLDMRSSTDLPTPIVYLGFSISALVKLSLVLAFRYYGKKSNSKMILANSTNMLNDAFISISGILSLLLIRLLGVAILDDILAIVLGLWIIYTAVALFLDSSNELMDASIDPEFYKKIFRIIEGIPKLSSPHKARIRKIYNLYDIVLDVFITENMSLVDAHNLSNFAEKEIRKEVADIFDIVIHLEPLSTNHHDIAYGLDVDSFKT